ncbi:hypothetical protein DFH29DRAFT_870870 [Suillus ampliporus]|nr:hypothetical protein DFH29DRAFT_870870 [Suillus ampliporus]
MSRLVAQLEECSPQVPVPSDSMMLPDMSVSTANKLHDSKATASARQLIHTLVEDTYPLFKFADDGWKLDYLATTSYPSWRCNNLDSDDQKSQDSIKKEDDDDNNGNTNSNEQIGNKCKFVPSSLSLPLSAPPALPAPVVNVPGSLMSLTITRANSKFGNISLSPDLDFSCHKSKPGGADTKNTTEPIKNTTEPLTNSESTTEHLADSESTPKPLTDSENTNSDETAISDASSKPRPVPAPKPLRIMLPNPLVMTNIP